MLSGEGNETRPVRESGIAGFRMGRERCEEALPEGLSVRIMLAAGTSNVSQCFVGFFTDGQERHAPGVMMYARAPVPILSVVSGASR